MPYTPLPLPLLDPYTAGWPLLTTPSTPIPLTLEFWANRAAFELLLLIARTPLPVVALPVTPLPLLAWPSTPLPLPKLDPYTAALPLPVRPNIAVPGVLNAYTP